MEEFIKIDLKDMPSIVMSRKEDGWRLGQMCSAFVDGVYELTYSFTKGQELINYRIIVEKEQVVPSITNIYSCAFLYENEMKELFGVKYEHIAVDYDNRLYRINEETPFIDKEGK